MEDIFLILGNHVCVKDMKSLAMTCKTLASLDATYFGTPKHFTLNRCFFCPRKTGQYIDVSQMPCCSICFKKYALDISELHSRNIGGLKLI